jgi:type I restriction enzyme S subunit
MLKTPLKSSLVNFKSQFMEQFEGYEKTRLGEIASITAGQSSPHDDEFSEEGTPFIKAGNLEDLKLLRISEQECNLVDEKTIKERNLKLHNSGTVLVAKSGMSCLSGHIYSLKKAAYVVSHLACIQPIDRTSTTEYIRTFFMTVGTKSLIRDVSYPAIQLAQFAEMEIPDVPYKEQIRFASFVRQSDKSKYDYFSWMLGGAA